eukprot:TRINITY_DN179_c0_g1_i3.p1 TRINITY_DN179_c0_g1~~TRINITY_DN179_c0_g1_i3.p1  ORF type:complete len:116 (-),score=51.13 TRINITY_DN179_c0_g1_i3:269-616(-)
MKIKELNKNKKKKNSKEQEEQDMEEDNNMIPNLHNIKSSLDIYKDQKSTTSLPNKKLIKEEIIDKDLDLIWDYEGDSPFDDDLIFQLSDPSLEIKQFDLDSYNPLILYPTQNKFN